MGGAEAAQRALRVGGSWAGGCSVLQLIFAAALRRAAASRPRSRLAALTPAERGTVANTAVAAVHAVFLFAGSVAFLAPRVDVAAAGHLLVPITSLEPMEAAPAFWAAAMLGYLAYDVGYNAVFAAAGLSRDMAAHHALGAYSWVALLSGDVGGTYIMWVHLAEVRHPAAWRALTAHQAAKPQSQTEHAVAETRAERRSATLRRASGQRAVSQRFCRVPRAMPRLCALIPPALSALMTPAGSATRLSASGAGVNAVPAHLLDPAQAGRQRQRAVPAERSAATAHVRSLPRGRRAAGAGVAVDAPTAVGPSAAEEGAVRRAAAHHALLCRIELLLVRAAGQARAAARQGCQGEQRR
jgi:hypothetical protein